MADQESVGAELNDNTSLPEIHNNMPTYGSATTTTQPQLSQGEAATQESCKMIESPSVQPSHDTMPSTSGSAETEKPLEDSNLQGVAVFRPVEPAASEIQLAVLEAQAAAEEFRMFLTNKFALENQPPVLEARATTEEFRMFLTNKFASENQPQVLEARAATEEFQNQPPVLEAQAEAEKFQNQPPVLEARATAEEFLKGGKHNYYRPLYHAANEGDWKTAKSFINRDASALTARITKDSLTILMVAARARKWKFMENLVEILPQESLAMQDVGGSTALHFVAIGGSLKTAKTLIRKNLTLPQIPDVNGFCPLISSLLGKCKELVWYLILVTKDEFPCFTFTGPPSATLITLLIRLGFHDITLYLVQKYPQPVDFKDENRGSWMLTCLSLTYEDFLSGSKLKFWERWIYKLVHLEIIDVQPKSILVNIDKYLGNAEYFPDIAASVQQRSFLTQVLQRLKRLLWKAAPPLQHIREAKLNHVYFSKLVNYLCEKISGCMNLEEIIEFLHRPPPVLTCAAGYGVIEIVRAFLQYFPDLVYGDISDILRVAIQVRQAKIFNLITTEMPTVAQVLTFFKDGSRNTTLHLAAKLPPTGTSTNQFLSVSGAAFQMQRELQWFEEVKNAFPLIDGTEPNNDALTPKELFTKQHKELAENGEKWMKDTANSGMIVTTLITTVVLAAAFTVPGGNNDKGIPNFLDRTSFLVFVVSDALALFSSATSLLMFLSILTARYAEKDFLRALPKRLIIALGSLFFAMATMMLAFGATLTIVLSEKWQWASIPIILLGSVPVTVFVMLQLPLFIQMIDSTYGSGIFGS